MGGVRPGGNAGYPYPTTEEFHGLTEAADEAFVIGLIDSFSRLGIPEFSYFAVFAPMALILVLRPRGLLGRAA